MKNTPTGCAHDLPTGVGISKSDPTSRSVNIFQQLDFDPNNIKNVHQPNSSAQASISDVR